MTKRLTTRQKLAYWNKLYSARANIRGGTKKSGKVICRSGKVISQAEANRKVKEIEKKMKRYE